LVAGNIVIVNYLVSSGEVANGAKTLTAPATIQGYSTVNVALTDSDAPASGGSPIETVASIKYLAPLMHQAQDRCVTAQDYQAVIQAYVSGVESIAVWGGEDGDPRDEDNTPIFGKVFVSIKPRGANFLSDLAKSQIINLVLKNRMVLTMDPIIIDPDYVYIVIHSLVKYRSTRTTSSADDIKQEIVDAIHTYADEELGQYGSYFRFSRFARAIDDSDPAITNSLTTLLLEKRFEPTLTERNNYPINFGNPLFQTTDVSQTMATIMSKTLFTHTDEQGNTQTGCFLENAGTTVKMYRYAGTVKTLVRANIGAVDYALGRVKLVGFEPTVIADGDHQIILRAQPASSDILPKQNQLLLIDDANVTVTMFDDTQTLTSTGTTGAITTTGASGGFIVDL
jgi:hypothetical protein